MTDEALGHLFVSYSHVDRPQMLRFRKHLKGMLLGRMQVWSDHDITKGSSWESLLEGSLTQANAALVLATPDYLVSPWCRKELKELAGAYRAQRLRNVFWVQLRPCGWQHTELAEFQSSDTSGERAISELQDEAERERAILRSCEVVAAEISRSITKEDRHLAFVRRLLLDAQERHELTVQEILHAGAFSIVCRGSIGSIDAAIKVLRRAPLERMSEDFVRIGESRMRVVDPSFVPIHKIFQVGPEEEKRTIIVSDYVSNSMLLSTFLEHGNPIPIGRAAPLLRRTSEALAALHGAAGPGLAASAGDKETWRCTLGLLTPGDIYYDPVAERLRMPAFGVSSFLWHVLDWRNYVDWVDPDAEIYVAPEQLSKGGRHVTPDVDQYMLGRLAVEVLEGRSFKRILEANAANPEDFWADPGSFVCGAWKRDHQQLWRIVSRLLAPRPQDRWSSMEEVVRRLRALEEEGRALAKRVFLPTAGGKAQGGIQLKNNVEFFERFYDAFFKASPESRGKFEDTNLKEQHAKLMNAMVAVLNFRQGNEPTSLDAILDKHRGKGITAQEFERFHQVFLATMDQFTGGDQRIRRAWDDLLKPVVEYMASECIEAKASTPKDAAAPGARMDARVARRDTIDGR
jgi:hemoglobin-like flavoprotein